MPTDAPSIVVVEAAKGRDRVMLTRRRVYFLHGWPWILIAGSMLFIGIVFLLVAAPLIVPHDPSAQNLLQRLSGPSSVHLLGTDQLGRDLLSRLMMGGRFSVLIAAVTLLLCVTIGTFIGIVGARAGGILDEALMRVVDLLLPFPDIVVAIFVVAIFGAGYGTLVASLTIIGWTPFARLARSLTLQINSLDYIRAAEVLGCSRTFIIVRHVIPNAIRPIAAISFLRFGHQLITVGGLSFLGLGVQPPLPDWALMLADARPYIERAPIMMFAPGLAIFLAALSVTWIGQGLEAMSDARSDPGADGSPSFRDVALKVVP
jgi:peptide/nickel transport system permease protein